MANGTIAFDTLTTSDQVKSGTEKSIDTSYIFNGVCKSWVNFDGSESPLTNRDSFNVSSLVDNGTGNYDQVFTNSMSSANYSVSGAIADNAPIASNRDRYFMAVSESASQINLNAFGQADMNFVYGQAFGDLA